MAGLQHILHLNTPPQKTETPTSVRTNPAVSGEDEAVDDHQDEATLETEGKKRAASNSRLSYPRKRAIRACQKCRLRRTKCDNVRPACTSCLDINAECIYSESDPSTFDTASLAILEKLNAMVPPHDTILERLDKIEALLQRGQRSDADLSSSTPISPVRHDGHVNHIGRAPGSIGSVLGTAAPEKPYKSIASKRMSIENILSWPAFAKYQPAIHLQSLLLENGPQRTPKLSMSQLQLFGDEDQLIQRYMENVFIYNPILEESEVQQYVREIQHTGYQHDSKSCLLLLIHAHGCMVTSEYVSGHASSTSFHQTHEFKRAESYFSAASQRMGSLMLRSTVLEAQCFFLAGVYLMSTLRVMEAWRMFAQALSVCQTFQLESTTAGEARDREKRLQQSLYWTCFKSELELRLELNVFDDSIWNLTYPDFYPSPPQSLRQHRELVWYYFLSEIALRRLSNRILTDFHKNKRSRTDIVSVIEYEHQAANWVAQLPPSLNITNLGLSPGRDLAESLKFILDGHLIDCFELLYWPYLAEIVMNGLVEPDRKEQEELAAKSLANCVERINKNEHGFFKRHHGTWLMLRSCTRSALMLLAAVKDANLCRLLPENWETAVSKVIILLNFWRDESRDTENRLKVIEGAYRDFVEGRRRNGHTDR